MRLELVSHDFRRFQDDVARLKSALGSAIVGQDAAIDDLVTAVLAGGHVLLEGLPGLGKTNLAKAMAKSVGVPLSRIQCTPDIMPSDITGSEVLAFSKSGAPQSLKFEPGPLFSPMVLVDEINRATPKTQSALLEAMQEGQVTYGGVRHLLPSPFWVLATQNMVELEGTYPLPEAQLDRFFAKIVIPYPARDALVTLAARSFDAEPSDRLEAALSADRVFEMMAQVREVVVSDHVAQAAVDLILGTQPRAVEASNLSQKYVLYGASPRALQSLLRAARVRALAAGRGHVALADLHSSALPVLRHRVFLTIASELDGVKIDDVLGELISEWFKMQSRAHS